MAALLPLQVSRLVHAIKMGWIKPRRPREDTAVFYDLWAQEDHNSILGRHKMHVPAPKLPLPGHEESYNPPPEYLPTEEEVSRAGPGFPGPKGEEVPAGATGDPLGWGLAPSSSLPRNPLQKLAWEQQEPSERKLNFVPQRHDCLRRVPAFPRFIHERFERCLDLYLCPRQRKMRVGFAALPLPGHLGEGGTCALPSADPDGGHAVGSSLSQPGQLLPAGTEGGRLPS